MKRVYSVVGLLLLFVVAAFVPVLFWVYVGVGGFRGIMMMRMMRVEA